MAFIVYDLTLEMLKGLKPLVDQVRRHDRPLADQMQRAGQSTFLILVSYCASSVGLRASWWLCTC